jgi:tetraacyldisaccharide-1-P 4'-kinase
MNQIEEDRVAQPLIIAAHDYASKEYLNQVVAELKNLVQLSANPKQNEDFVEVLISAFSGLPTPFEFDKCLNQVLPRFEEHATVSRDRIRDALQLMKQVGIFEERPGYAGWWRVGRLFKTALGMKYVR